MNRITIITGIVLLITIFSSISGFCQTEYYYDYNKYVAVEYSDSFLAIEKNESLTDWSNFFDDNDYLERLDNPFPMPNGMYLMKLKDEADINSSLIQLSNSNEIDKIERAWNSDKVEFMFPANRLVVYFKDKNAKYIADSVAVANSIPEYRMFLGRENCYLFETKVSGHTNALNLANQIYESGLALFSQVDFLKPIEFLFTPNDPLYPYQSVGRPDILVRRSIRTDRNVCPTVSK